MNIPKSYSWRKATDINREYATFELIENGRPILDIGFSDAGILEISFNNHMATSPIEWEKLQKLVEEGKRLAVLDQ